MNISPDYGHMLHDYYRRQLLPFFSKRRKRLNKLQTRQDALSYVADVKNKIKQAFGPMPEKTSLNSRTIAKVEYADYFLEKVIYESRPDFPISALLYLPKEIDGKIPAVLASCGHYAAGKAGEAYQLYCQGLAKKGFAVLIYDPVSQGERHQFDKINESDAIAGSCVLGHNMVGKEMRMCGEFLGSWRAWDGIRGIDYLCSRPEIDSSRLGVTGNSGGGTTCSYISALDDRPIMMASSCYITSFMRNFDNELPCDSEQIPPGLIASGCDMADFIIAQAPRPSIMLAKTNDFFDPRGTQEAYEDAKKIYALLGAENNIQLALEEGNHGYTQGNRESMYKLFCSCVGFDDDGKEGQVSARPEEELFCTPNGNTAKLEGAKVIADFTRERADQLAHSGKGAANLPAALAEILKIIPSKTVPEYNILRPKKVAEDIVCSKFGLTTEEGITCILRYFDEMDGFFALPKNESVTLYISHLDAVDEWRKGINGLETDTPFFALDVRGTGDSTPATCGSNSDYFHGYDFDYFYASQSIMLDKTYLGGKVQDVLATVNLLKANGATSINLVGCGLGAIVSAFAASLTVDVDKITLINAPVSYRQMIEDVMTRWPLSHMPPGILKVCDLPEIYKFLENKSLKLINQWDSMFREN